MVTFARARAKSIFLKIWTSKISKNLKDNQEKNLSDGRSLQKENNSESFFEAIKSGGIWLS